MGKCTDKIFCSAFIAEVCSFECRCFTIEGSENGYVDEECMADFIECATGEGQVEKELSVAVWFRGAVGQSGDHY